MHSLAGRRSAGGIGSSSCCCAAVGPCWLSGMCTGYQVAGGTRREWREQPACISRVSSSLQQIEIHMASCLALSREISIGKVI